MPPRVICGLVFRPIFKTNSRIFKSFRFVFGFDGLNYTPF
nr:MAG TPA: hypothetical protein [Caudoviricetes sp.]